MAFDAPTSVPTATYRLQFHRGFTFQQAGAILDYLQALGISHVYSSPYFHASESSNHGYDVADHNRLNPAVGSERDYTEFIGALRERRMGQILDFVPNHMGINEPINKWWMDVLENGPSSQFAGYFDIEWHPVKEELENKVLLPILGDRYGKILERAEFKLSCEEGAFFLHYHESKLPLNPRSYPLILDRVTQHLQAYAGSNFHDELQSISTAMGNLPQRSRTHLDAVRLRAREKEVGKRRLARLLADESVARTAVKTVLVEIEGCDGQPETFDLLHQLLCAQVYRLAYWRVAAEEINYRRFFDINSLAAIRTEIPAVFEASHNRVFQMIERAEVTGLRIDHVDGLWDPQSYLAQLQARCRNPGEADGRPLYVIVEKILGADETIPEDWATHGTTGYEFTWEVTGMMVDQSAEEAFSKVYAAIVGDQRFEDVIYEKKLLVTRMALASEVAVLGRMLNRFSETNRHYRDFTLRQLTAAVRETLACFPVYRSYVAPSRTVRPEDRLNILRSVRRARRRNPSIDKPIFDFLAKTLLLELQDETNSDQVEQHLKFVMKFQQVSGPVMAKGLEDTSFYTYHRLIALNEVGGDPGRFGLSPKEFHERCERRLTAFPHTLLATSTHDTKRSEDVRARLAAISEFPAEWQQGLNQWRSLAAPCRTVVDGQVAPSPNEEYLFYQTLVGAWPLEGLTEENRGSFAQRIKDYMLKALKEAKVNSSWVEPNEEWENATARFVEALLSGAEGDEFRRSFQPFIEQVAEVGACNSLTQTLLKCTVPGVPDIYQGCELWDFSLVDPDNRRPVDYEIRQRALATVAKAKPAELLRDWRSGRIKLFMLQRLLRLRHERREIFEAGSYRPIEASGTFRDHVYSFSRGEGPGVVVVAPRLTRRLGRFPLGASWGDTVIDLPAGDWQDLFTGTQLAGGRVDMSRICTRFPFACLIEVVAESKNEEF